MNDVVDMGRPLLNEGEREAVERVLRSGRLVQGPEVDAFERELAAELSGTRHALAVASGTAALDLALSALGVGEGDEVVTTPFTFPATVNAIVRSGATVRFADIGEDFLLDPRAAADAVSDRTSLILAVHLYGLPCDVEALRALGAPVLEDAAQAHLASAGSRRAGSLGVAATFSFYASKNMTTGEGGAVTTDDPSIAERVRELRNQGMREHYAFASIGWNLRLSELAAAIGRVQLGRLPKLTQARTRIATLLYAALEGTEGMTLPLVPEGRRHAWHRFTIQLERDVDRDAVREKLRADGIESAVHYPWIVPDLEPYAGHPRIDASLPLERARAAARTVLSIPVHPEMTEEDVSRVAASVGTALSSARSGRR